MCGFLSSKPTLTIYLTFISPKAWLRVRFGIGFTEKYGGAGMCLEIKFCQTRRTIRTILFNVIRRRRRRRCSGPFWRLQKAHTRVRALFSICQEKKSILYAPKTFTTLHINAPPRACYTFTPIAVRCARLLFSPL